MKRPTTWRACPVCELALVDRLPVCGDCWAEVPFDVKRTLANLGHGTPAYDALLARVVARLAELATAAAATAEADAGGP